MHDTRTPIPEGLEWVSDALCFDVAKSAKIAGRAMSATTISGVLKCPAQWLSSRVIRAPRSPLHATVLGDTAHRFLEHWFTTSAPERRTLEQARTEWDAWLEKEEPQTLSFAERDEWEASLTRCVEGYLTGGCEDPLTPDVVGSEIRFTTSIDGVPFTGAIDRVDLLHNGHVRIVDYKTNSNTDHPEDNETQQRLYVLAAKSIPQIEGRTVDGARLLYIRLGTFHDVPLTEGHMAQAVARLHETRRLLDQSAQTGLFECRPSALCPWCPVAATCPSFNKRLASGRLRMPAKKPQFEHTATELPIPTRIERRACDDEKSMAENRSSDAQPPTQPSGSGVMPPTPPNRYPPVCPDGRAPWDECGPAKTGPDDQPHSQPNPGSYAAGAVNDLTGYAQFLLYDAGITPTPKQLKFMALTLVSLVAEVQVWVSGQWSWQTGSNLRARDLLKAVLKQEPHKPPFTGDSTAWAAWYAQVLTAVKEWWSLQYILLTMSEDTVGKFSPEALASIFGTVARVVEPPASPTLTKKASTRRTTSKTPVAGAATPKAATPPTESEGVSVDAVPAILPIVPNQVWDDPPF